VDFFKVNFKGNLNYAKYILSGRSLVNCPVKVVECNKTCLHFFCILSHVS
jgi:hypothetical protein